MRWRIAFGHVVDEYFKLRRSSLSIAILAMGKTFGQHVCEYSLRSALHVYSGRRLCMRHNQVRTLVALFLLSRTQVELNIFSYARTTSYSDSIPCSQYCCFSAFHKRCLQNGKFSKTAFLLTQQRSNCEDRMHHHCRH